jgi:hypothetical protein
MFCKYHACSTVTSFYWTSVKTGYNFVNLNCGMHMYIQYVFSMFSNYWTMYIKILYSWILLLDILGGFGASGAFKAMCCCVLTSCMLYQITRPDSLKNPCMSNWVLLPKLLLQAKHAWIVSWDILLWCVKCKQTERTCMYNILQSILYI